MTTPLDSTIVTPADLNVSGKPQNLHEAAKQFEALLIGQMLKSAREEDGDGWLGGGGDSGAESAFGMAETQFAQVIAERGGMGLARTIEHSVMRQVTARDSRA